MIASDLRVVSSEQVVTDAFAELNHVQFGKNIGSAVWFRNDPARASIAIVALGFVSSVEARFVHESKLVLPAPILNHL